MQRVVAPFTLPVTEGPLRFALRHPDGRSSNSWRAWTTRTGDAYLTCADNYREMKASLHASGRWRFGFTQESTTGAVPTIKLSKGENRAWKVWTEPMRALPLTVVAFRLVFLPEELAVDGTRRSGRKWRDLAWITAAPDQHINFVTVFVTDGLPNLRYEGGPSDTLATMPLKGDRWLQIVAHIEKPTAQFREMVSSSVEAARRHADQAGVVLPQRGRLLLFGDYPANGSHHIIEVNLHLETTTHT
jgi:hypothetical protein